MTDMFGRDIKAGDIVCFPSSAAAGRQHSLKFAMVLDGEPSEGRQRRISVKTLVDNAIEYKVYKFKNKGHAITDNMVVITGGNILPEALTTFFDRARKAHLDSFKVEQEIKAIKTIDKPMSPKARYEKIGINHHDKLLNKIRSEVRDA